MSGSLLQSSRARERGPVLLGRSCAPLRNAQPALTVTLVSSKLDQLLAAPTDDLWWARAKLTRRAPAWLESLYGLVASNRHDEALDLVFERFDQDPAVGDPADALNSMDVAQLDANTIVGVLAATKAMAEAPSRRGFLERASQWLHEHEPARAVRLLQGLE